MYFLSNICAKNYENRFVFVKAIARQINDIFAETIDSRRDAKPTRYSFHYELFIGPALKTVAHIPVLF